MIKSLFSRALALLLCVTALAPVVLAADPSYTVESVSETISDPDVLAIYHLDKSCSNSVDSSLFACSSSSTRFASHPDFGYSLDLGGDQRYVPTSWVCFSPKGSFDSSPFCVEFQIDLSDFNSQSIFYFRSQHSVSSSPASYDILSINSSSSKFLNSTEYISSGDLIAAFFTGTYVSVKIVFLDNTAYLFVDGQLLGSGVYSGPSDSWFSFYSTRYYAHLDEVRFSVGRYTENLDSYTPATTPFDVPVLPVLPASPVENCIYVQTAIPSEFVQIGGDVPAEPASGVVHIATSPANTAESIQIYDGSGWVPVSAQIYADSSWHDVIGYPFSISPGEDDPPGDAVHPFLVTPFSDYTVTEGLLLALLLCVVVFAVIKLLKEGFFWLW